jgi:hypothetical protein
VPTAKAALGMKLAADTEMNKQFVCQIVGGKFNIGKTLA